MVAPGGLPDSARSSREVIRKGTGIEKTCAARRGAIRPSDRRGAAGAWPVK